MSIESQTIAVAVVAAFAGLLLVVNYIAGRRKRRKGGGGCSGCGVTDCPLHGSAKPRHSATRSTPCSKSSTTPD